MDPTDTAPPILDPVHLERVSGGTPELQRDLLGLLRRELPRAQAWLAQAGAHGDSTVLHETAHKLQGMAAYTGARRLGVAAAGLESTLGDGEQSRVSEALNEVRVALEELNSELASKQF